MEYVVTAERRFREDWGKLVNEMNAQAHVRAGALEGEETPCELHFSVADDGELYTACLPVATFALSVVSPALIASDMRSSPNGLTAGLEAATIEAIAKAGAMRHTKWLEIASKRMEQNLLDNPMLSMEGFLRFRMRDLLDMLHNELHSLLGVLNIEEEYRHFIELLKRYAAVNRDETKTVTVSFNQNGGYTLLTASGRRLLSVPWQFDVQESGNMLITLLDSISPARVVVHGSALVPQRLRSIISDMFGKRVRFHS
ncbi:MAG: sporulation protein YtxC [Bacillota bacterium]